MNRSSVCKIFAAITLGMLLSGSGCSNSGFYPVSGKVVDPSGQPIAGLEGSEIVFSQSDGNNSSVGEIAADGSFSMFTNSPGDGVPPGDYTVYIPRRRIDSEREAPASIEARFEKPASSGIQAKVEPKRNKFEFKVDPVKKR